MRFNLDLPSYDNLSAQDMATRIGLNVKHIPILVQSFQDEGRGILRKLDSAIQAKSYKDISIQAHSLKGSSGNLKFNELYELTKVMEISAKEKNEDFPYSDAFISIKKAIKSISL